MTRSLTAALVLLLAGCAGSGSSPANRPGLHAAAAAHRFAAGAMTGLPGERLNAVPGMPSDGTPGERLNAVPGNPQALCAQPVAGSGAASCPVETRDDLGPQPDPNMPYARIAGYKPRDLAAAYRIPSGPGFGRTVALVDAFDDPAVEADLAVYRHAMGLPACTSAGGCFIKRLAHGSGVKTDAGWAAETALDVEMVSAVCPLCKIVLVEAKSDKLKDLAAAEVVAASYAPDAIGNSFYAPEDPAELKYADSFAPAGIAVTAAAGDEGFRTNFPASLASVVAVGATSLLPDGSARGWSELIWSASASGCSTLVPQPAWQTDAGCAGRAVADVAVVGDPRTGVAAYSSVAAPGRVGGWIVAGGTSVGTPVVAALYALAGNAAGIVPPQRLWQRRGSLFAPSGALTGGYGGPAGNGTPSGLDAF